MKKQLNKIILPGIKRLTANLANGFNPGRISVLEKMTVIQKITKKSLKVLGRLSESVKSLTIVG